MCEPKRQQLIRERMEDLIAEQNWFEHRFSTIQQALLNMKICLNGEPFND